MTQVISDLSKEFSDITSIVFMKKLDSALMAVEIEIPYGDIDFLKAKKVMALLFKNSIRSSFADKEKIIVCEDNMQFSDFMEDFCNKGFEPQSDVETIFFGVTYLAMVIMRMRQIGRVKIEEEEDGVGVGKDFDDKPIYKWDGRKDVKTRWGKTSDLR